MSQQMFYRAPYTKSLQAWLNGQAWAPGEVWGWGIETRIDTVYWERLYGFYYEVFNHVADHEVVEVGGIPLISCYNSHAGDSFLPLQIGNWIARADQEWAILIGQEQVLSKETRLPTHNRMVGAETDNLKAFERDWLVLMMATT